MVDTVGRLVRAPLRGSCARARRDRPIVARSELAPREANLDSRLQFDPVRRDRDGQAAALVPAPQARVPLVTVARHIPVEDDLVSGLEDLLDTGERSDASAKLARLAGDFDPVADRERL